jgi:hypothetical protein
MAKHGPDESWRQHVINNVLPKMEATAEQLTGFTPAPANPQPFSVGMHLQPQFDVIERVPEKRKDLFRNLCQHSDDKHALIPTGFDVQAASAARVEAAHALKRLTDHPQDGGFGLPPTDARVVAAQRHLDKMTDEFARVQDRQKKTSAAWLAASAPKAVCDDFLRFAVPGNCKLEAVEVEPPKLNKGETVLDGIERLRRRCRELKADLHRIASAPYPSAYCKQQMREQIEALAMQGAPSVSSLIELDGKIEWPMKRIQADVFVGDARGFAFFEVFDSAAYDAWLHGEAAIKRLDAEITTESDDKAALSHEVRQQREAEVMGDLLAVERDESTLVWQAQSQGLPVEHRADISPLALLGLKLTTTPPATELPGTTPGLSWVRK